MKGKDEVVDVVKQVTAMAELIALKPQGDRNIRLYRSTAKLLERNSDDAKVQRLRDYLRQHEITVHEVAEAAQAKGQP